MTVRYALAPLPPLYAVHCARTGLYLAAFLLPENRDLYVSWYGWRVVS